MDESWKGHLQKGHWEGLSDKGVLGFSLLVSSFFVSLLYSDDFTGLFDCYFCVYISCPFFIGNFKCIFISFSTIRSFGDCMIDGMLIVFLFYIEQCFAFCTLIEQTEF